MNFSEKKVNAILILEAIGRPPEHLTETLDNLAKKIGEEKGIDVKEARINPPVLMKEQKDFYTSFAEIEVEAEKMLYVLILMFKYMPAHIEIISPQNLSLTNSSLNDILNELTRRLHGYEEIVRILQTEKMILENKLKGSINIQKENKEEEKPKKEKKKK